MPPHPQTVFETNTQQKSVQYEVMKNKRAAHGEIIKNFQKKVAEIQRETEQGFVDTVSTNRANTHSSTNHTPP